MLNKENAWCRGRVIHRVPAQKFPLVKLKGCLPGNNIHYVITYFNLKREDKRIKLPGADCFNNSLITCFFLASLGVKVPPVKKVS